ncbi:MAG: PPOX class F420-dependent oxidoreductase [Nitrososphaeraceae archaeon]|nr:PPOX class F420-dependent oxidoreductase [Nitrososphaeraceae archaeon]
MKQNIFDKISSEKYINLQTQRKDGNFVSTPVWFVIKDDEIFIRSGSNSGKIKRIRNNKNVKFASCNIKGKIKGEVYDAIANFEFTSDYKEINLLFDKKYRVMVSLLKIFYKLKKINLKIVSLKLKDKSTTN